jgi:beta-lactamase superfamily II metal-dependent hydrolase
MYRLLLFSLYFATPSHAQDAMVGKPLPAWQAGYLDLHHINTGRGNASFFIFPDGTNLLVDAGELDPTAARTTSPRNTPIRPDNSKRPFEWIADYIRQFAPLREKTVIDYALITHFHDDHFGGWYPGAPLSTDKKFVRSGITGIGDILPVTTLLTRNYNFPVAPDSLLKQLPANNRFVQSWNNFTRFIASARSRGMQFSFLQAGSATQIHLLHKANAYPGFRVRNLKSNGLIWTGKDSAAAEHFPTVDPANRKTWPDENTLSNAILITYGGFSYYTGGDNPGNVFFGDAPWRDTETSLAKVIGKADVATMDHHGNRDAVNENFVKTVQPRIWIEQVWTADHPGHEVLIRVMSKMYEGPRDVFATNLMEANKLVIGGLVDQAYRSTQGHIVVRVLPGGKTYYVIILDDAGTDRLVKAVFGPYTSKN